MQSIKAGIIKKSALAMRVLLCFFLTTAKLQLNFALCKYGDILSLRIISKRATE